MSNVSTFQIAGMTCDACQKVIQKRLGKLEGVTEVFADKTTGMTEVTANRSIDADEIQDALKGTDYSVVQ